MHLFIPAALLSLAIASAAGAADREPSAPAPQLAPQAPRTAKERLSDKASDEQRVNDCKVPAERRTGTRPAACPWDVGS